MRRRPLRTLELDSNRLDARGVRAILVAVVSSGRALETLGLNAVRAVTALPDGLQTACPRLRTLRASVCAVAELPAGLPDSLRELHFGDNPGAGDGVADKLRRLTNLTTLGMHRTAKHTELPAGSLPPSLRTLVLERSAGLSLPGGLALPNLRVLALGHCGLTELPAGVGAGLEMLSLAGSEGLRIPEGGFGLPALRALSLSQCMLDEDATPPWDWLPPTLTRLTLSHNYTGVRPAEFPPLPELQKLELANCGFRRVRLPAMPKLRELDLSSNARLHIEPGDLPPGVEELNLTACKLEDMPVALPGALTSLQLGSNRQLRAATLPPLPRLRELALWNCNLYSLPDGLRALYPALEKLDVSANPGLDSLSLSGDWEGVAVRGEGLKRA